MTASVFRKKKKSRRPIHTWARWQGKGKAAPRRPRYKSDEQSQRADVRRTTCHPVLVSALVFGIHRIRKTAHKPGVLRRESFIEERSDRVTEIMKLETMLSRRQSAVVGKSITDESFFSISFFTHSQRHPHVITFF